jgi:hypothetical protein
MTLFPPAREEGRALRWGARRLSCSRVEEGAILSVLEWGIARRWDAGELPSTRPQARVGSAIRYNANSFSRGSGSRRAKRHRRLVCCLLALYYDRQIRRRHIAVTGQSDGRRLCHLSHLHLCLTGRHRAVLRFQHRQIHPLHQGRAA